EQPGRPRRHAHCLADLTMPTVGRRLCSILAAFLASGLILGLATPAVPFEPRQPVHLEPAGNFSKSSLTVPLELKPIFKTTASSQRLSESAFPIDEPSI